MALKSFTHHGLLLMLLAAAGVSCVQHEVGNREFPDGVMQIAVQAGDIRWKPCPPGLPQGCELALLEGHPKQSELFTVRFRLADSFVMRPHTHPKHERVTILEGRVRVAFGTQTRRGDARVFGPGDYYVNSKDAVHQVWIDETAILQITGVGPWQVNFVTQP